MRTDPDGVTIGHLLRDARQRLARAPFDVPRREAALLLARVLDRSEAGVLAHFEEAVAPDAVARFGRLLERRLTGEPVAYLFGEREFYGRPFAVDSRVLIPRPETEHLIEAVRSLELPASPRIIDVGTGSGAIAVTLALEIIGSRVLATDVSPPALEVARANVRRHGVARSVPLAAVDAVSALDLSRIDLLVSNPPYIDPAVTPELSTEVTDFEPHQALFAADRGRAVMRCLLDQGIGLRAGTHLVLEIGHDQSKWLEAAVEKRAAWQLVEIVRDYADIPRTAVLRRSTLVSSPRMVEPGGADDVD